MESICDSENRDFLWYNDLVMISGHEASENTIVGNRKG